MHTLDTLTRLEKEASEFGFKWETPQQIKAQIESELKEIDVHLHDKDTEKLQEEIGDLLHAVFSLCLFCNFDPQETLAKSVMKFERRFSAVKELAKTKGWDTLNGKSFNELMEIWNEAKKG
jgi:uncharacterized protein YabN with tetrapyrrole methylase and pyrophosphatase domain